MGKAGIHSRLERLPAMCFLVDTSQEDGIAFAEIGPVELKGASGAVDLLRAHHA